ncbi:MAG: phosphate signaling complex protein PhoU [Planctomycetota bacterium]|jgi:phosphate transport system protein|nr:phosphate signaling complex protein PhoU [Planctomycetota bacterium]
MSIHLHREMENLNRAALEMCAHVEQNVRDAARAFLGRDWELARKVIDADRHVDRMEMDLAENCLKTLALYQPVASDLRFIFSLSKISGILERIGDLAENLARKGKSLSQLEPVVVPKELTDMADQARAMLKDSIDSFVDRDAIKARDVIKADGAVNAGKRLVRKAGEEAILEKPAFCSQWLIVISASRNVERMADMAANIATEVVYSVEGKMIRHGFDCE